MYLLPCFGAYFGRIGGGLADVLCCICMWFGCWVYKDRAFEGDKALGSVDKKVDWVRALHLDVGAQEADKKMRLFRGIEPADVCQGALGDCWLVGAMAGLAEYPAAVRNCFVNVEASSRGKYQVRLWCGRADRWITVTVDDRVPCLPGTKSCIFMQPNGGEMWTILLEKAFAKFCGSYGNLKGGFAGFAWHCMTGDYVFQFHLDKSKGVWERKDLVFGGKSVGGAAERCDHWFGSSRLEGADRDADAFFSVLLQYSHKQSLMGAFFHVAGGGESVQSSGLVAGHLYSILDVRRAGTTLGMGRGYRLVKLRNPWASGEWRGAWSDGSDEWRKHPSVKTEVGYEDKDDGSFWMAYEDFAATFTAVEICDRTTKNDLCLDVREDAGACGPALGCVAGCAGFWCLCRGARTVYLGNTTSNKTERGAGCCVTK